MNPVWPDLQLDDVTLRTADDLDVELLREFFGSSLGENIAKSSREDDTSPKPSTSTPSLLSIASPSAPSSSTSMPSTSPAPPTSSTAASSSRKRKLTQERSCVNCQTHESSMWRRDPEGRSLCNACGQHYYKFKVHRPAEMFNRPIKKRCRKVKQDETKAASSTLLLPMNNFNFGMAPPYWFQQQPQQIVNNFNYGMGPEHHFQQQPHPNPPSYAYYQPASPNSPQFAYYPPPPPEAYHPYGHPAYPMMPPFQQGQW